VRNARFPIGLYPPVAGARDGHLKEMLQTDGRLGFAMFTFRGVHRDNAIRVCSTSIPQSVEGVLIVRTAHAR
jgi:hypothetical protein